MSYEIPLYILKKEYKQALNNKVCGLIGCNDSVVNIYIEEKQANLTTTTADIDFVSAVQERKNKRDWYNTKTAEIDSAVSLAELQLIDFNYGG